MEDLVRRYGRREPRKWTFLKTILAMLLALAIGLALNWLLWYLGINPFHIRDADW